jgi:hypothetical protein
MIDPMGKRFGRLTVMDFLKKGNSQSRMKCLCDCGKSCIVRLDHLMDGSSLSCGCWRRERCRDGDLGFKHGHAHNKNESKTYHTWHGMKSRCLNPNASNFGRYGGIGIRVCLRWMEFKNFLEDMGERPLGTTIDRIDPSGDYCKDNCRWADIKTQTKNKRRT